MPHAARRAGSLPVRHIHFIMYYQLDDGPLPLPRFGSWQRLWQHLANFIQCAKYTRDVNTNSHSPSTRRRCSSRISSAMLVRESRTSSGEVPARAYTCLSVGPRSPPPVLVRHPTLAACAPWAGFNAARVGTRQSRRLPTADGFAANPQMTTRRFPPPWSAGEDGGVTGLGLWPWAYPFAR